MGRFQRDTRGRDRPNDIGVRDLDLDDFLPLIPDMAFIEMGQWTAFILGGA